MSIFDILGLFLGLSLFLFGMNLMGETLKKSAGSGLKNFLGRVTSNKIKGFFFGALVTAIIQSSTATTVMIVGFINSGAMQLSSAISVIMGANVGTAATSWITALSGFDTGASISSVMQWFKPSSFTPVLAGLGIILFLVAKSERKRNIGVILLGFSVLMLGMDTMADSVSGLRDNESFKSVLLMFENPLLGLLAGTIITAIVQSSSASIGILQSFTATGAITFGNAVPIIMGQNIGTCITALLASVGTNKNAKRASVIHLMFNVFGSVIGLGVFYALKFVLRLELLDGRIDMWGIAAVHTLFNLLSVAVLFPFSHLLEKFAVKLVRDGKDSFDLLDTRLLDTPTVAVARAKELCADMGGLALDTFETSTKMLESGFFDDLANKVDKNEKLIDIYEDKLGSYLVKISGKNIYDNEGREIGAYLQLLGDVERIGDHSVNITDAAREIKEKNIHLSKETKEDLSVLVSAVSEILTLSIGTLEKQSILGAELVLPLEDVIDGLCHKIKSRHNDRLRQNIETIESSIILGNILTDLERIADHSSNIAGCILDIFEDKKIELHRHNSEYRRDRVGFSATRKIYSEKYQLQKKN